MRKRRNSGGGGWTRTNDLRPGTALLSRTEKAETVAPRATCEKDEILLAAVGLEPTAYAQGQLCCPVQKKAETVAPRATCEKDEILVAAVGLEPTTYGL